MYENTHIYTDHLGSVILAVDGSDHSVQQFIDYYPYGEESINERGDGGFESIHTHTGNISDDTELLYRNARYYDPNIGRFISKDPVVDHIGNPTIFEAFTATPFINYLTEPQAHNSYSYALNNPLKYEDPDGDLPHVVVTALIGATTGLVFQGVSDLVMGNPVEYQNYVGAFTNGAIIGAVAGTGVGLIGLAVAGAGGGFADGFISEGLYVLTNDEKEEINWEHVAEETIYGGIAGGISAGVKLRVPGITSGKGSHLAVWRGVSTKLQGGTIRGVAPSTFGKAVSAHAARQLPGEAFKYTGSATTSYLNRSSLNTRINNLRRQARDLQRRIIKLRRAYE